MDYFNLSKSSTTLSYQPYMYDGPNAKAHVYSGIALIGVATTTALLSVFLHGASDSKNIYSTITGGSLVLGLILLYNGIRLLLEIKIKLVFDKHNDTLWQISSFGRRKRIALSNIYDVITVSENMSYSYAVTSKTKASAKPVYISTYLTKKRSGNPEMQFLDDELIPAVMYFIGLSNITTAGKQNITS